ncbi:MAG: hypothetical protein JXD23_13415 [Spirochaetales bacterium]|nr:hypothetical protein [Spirochaetales bacterium]
MEYAVFTPAEAAAGPAGDTFQTFRILTPVVGIAGVAFLISAIGMLKRKNVFRIAFVTLLGLANAGFIVLFIGTFFNFGLMPGSHGSFFPGGTRMNLMFTIMNIVFMGVASGGVIVLIVFIMSKRASVDFRKPDEPDRPEEKQ